jgi:pimeloyl-ACP methyl ester carboxylesterase
MTNECVLLHGLTFDHRMWEPVRAALPPDARVLAPDLPGHGDAPMMAGRGLSAAADAIRDAITEAGLDRPVLVGHSIAGPIATIYASRYPTAGVITVDVSLHVEPFAAGLAALRPQLEGDGFDRAWSVFQDSMRMDAVPPEHRELIRCGDHASQAVVLAYQADLLERPLADVVAERDQGLAELRARELPYLAIFGSPIAPEERAWYAVELPHAEVEVWDVGHHFPHLAKPKWFAGRLVEFAGQARLARTL